MNAPINVPVLANVNTPQLLISVTSIEETQIALENGADIIDLKEPSLGALGALPIEKIQAIVTFVKATKNSDNKLTSATIGDLPMQPELLLSHVTALALTGVDIIKIGFFETDDYQTCLNALESATQAGLKLIAVLFAEVTYPENLVEAIKYAGFIGVMLDTANKNGLTLLDYYTTEKRNNFARNIFKHNLKLGLAGSLRLEHVAIIKEINPSYIGFRGGVCVGNQRSSVLDPEKIKAVRKTM
jgi:(5-formylfuran-3-yl)methyl phosphate synthase